MESEFDDHGMSMFSLEREFCIEPHERHMNFKVWTSYQELEDDTMK